MFNIALSSSSLTQYRYTIANNALCKLPMSVSNSHAAGPYRGMSWSAMKGVAAIPPFVCERRRMSENARTQHFVHEETFAQTTYRKSTNRSSLNRLNSLLKGEFIFFVNLLSLCS
jgi:hypothetical protein